MSSISAGSSPRPVVAAADTAPNGEAPEPARRGVAALISDVPASMVTFLVAVPLSMGIALASGAPIMSGLISGAIGGLIVGALSGVPLQVSGPAAGLAVIVFNYIHQFGLRTVAAITLCAGLMQIAL